MARRDCVVPRTWVLAGLLVVAAAGCAPPWTATTKASPSATASPTTTPTAALGPFACSDQKGGNAGVGAQLSADGVRAGRYDGIERIVFEFGSTTGGRGLPEYQLSRTPTAHFRKDPSDLPLDLDGSAGLRVVFRNSSLVDPGSPPSLLKPSFPIVREIGLLGNFEGVLSYAVGLGSAACIRVLELTEPSRLAIDFVSI